LHAVQRTSTRFLTTAHFNNKGYTTIYKSLQKFKFHRPISLACLRVGNIVKVQCYLRLVEIHVVEEIGHSEDDFDRTSDDNSDSK